MVRRLVEPNQKELYSVAGLLLIKEFIDWTFHRLTGAQETHLLIERFSKHAVFEYLRRVR